MEQILLPKFVFQTIPHLTTIFVLASPHSVCSAEYVSFLRFFPTTPKWDPFLFLHTLLPHATTKPLFCSLLLSFPFHVRVSSYVFMSILNRLTGKQWYVPSCSQLASVSPCFSPACCRALCNLFLVRQCSHLRILLGHIHTCRQTDKQKNTLYQCIS